MVDGIRLPATQAKFTYTSAIQKQRIFSIFNNLKAFLCDSVNNQDSVFFLTPHIQMAYPGTHFSIYPHYQWIHWYHDISTTTWIQCLPISCASPSVITQTKTKVVYYDISILSSRMIDAGLQGSWKICHMPVFPCNRFRSRWANLQSSPWQENRPALIIK